MTKFYLPSTGNADISPTDDAGWSHLASGVLGPLNAVTTKIGSAMATISYADTDTSSRVIRFGMWVSAALPAVTITAQTVGISVKCSETDTSNNMYLYLKIWVATPALAERGVILALQSDDTEAPTTIGSRYHSATSGQVIASGGDRIVFEIGMAGDPGVGDHDSSMIFGDDAATDLDASDGDTGTDNPWINFTQDLFGDSGSGIINWFF